MTIDPEVIPPSNSAGFKAVSFIPKWAVFSLLGVTVLIFVGIFWNGIGALSLGLTGNIIWSYIPILILGSLLGGYFGAQLSILKGSKFIKYVFEIVSLFVGISLLIKSYV